MEVHPLIDSIAEAAKNNERGFKVNLEPTPVNTQATLVLYRTGSGPLVYIELKIQLKENGSFSVASSTMPRIEAPSRQTFATLDKSFEDYVNNKCKKFK